MGVEREPGILVDMGYYGWGSRPTRPVRQRSAPLCTWPDGCRRKTWDVSGRCPAHRAAGPDTDTAAGVPPPVVAAGADPFAGEETEAQKLLGLLEWGGDREAIGLAEAGVTADDWPMWSKAFKGFGQADQIYWAATHGVTPDMLPVLCGLADPYKGLSRFVKDPATGTFDRTVDWDAVRAWAEMSPSLPPVAVDRLVTEFGWRPDSEPAVTLLAAGVDPHELTAWAEWIDKGHGDVTGAVGWAQAGFTRRDAVLLADAGFGAGDAASRLAGLPDGYLDDDLDQLKLATGTVPIRRSVKVIADAAGIDRDLLGRYDSAGVHGVLDMVTLTRAGVTPTEYRKWRRGTLGRSGLDIDAGSIASAARAGVAPADAEVYADVGAPRAGWGALTAAGATGDQVLVVLADADDGLYRKEIAGRKECPPQTLTRIATDTARTSPAAARAVAGRDDAPPEALAALAAHDDVFVRRAVAFNASTPPEALTPLAADPDAQVRSAAARHPNLPAAGKAAGGLLAD